MLSLKLVCVVFGLACGRLIWYNRMISFLLLFVGDSQSFFARYSTEINLSLSNLFVWFISILSVVFQS